MHFSVDDIARVCHEANRGMQLVTGDPAPSPSWDDAPDWQRETAAAGVREALAGRTPEQLHDAWSAAKRADGWTYGPRKDAQAKTHPCLVPYGDLPAAEQLKDRLFLAVVDALKE